MWITITTILCYKESGHMPPLRFDKKKFRKYGGFSSKAFKNLHHEGYKYQHSNMKDN